MYIPVEGDPRPGGIIKTVQLLTLTRQVIKLYIARRDKELSEKEKLVDLETKVESLQNDIGEIKDLLRKALDK